MRKLMLLSVDLFFFAISPFLALLLRENFELTASRIEDVVLYASVLIPVSACMLVASGMHRGVWRFTSTAELPRLLLVVTVSLLSALFITFAVNRLQGVSRSLPVLQWLLIVGGLLLVRFLARSRMLTRHRRAKGSGNSAATLFMQHNVLVLGVNEVASLYLRSAADYGSPWLRVAGVLARQERHRGRTVQLHKVLGTYAEITSVLDDLALHGVFVDRIAVAEPFDRLEPAVRATLLDLERAGRIEIDHILDNLRLTSPAAARADSLRTSELAAAVHTAAPFPARAGGFATLKRALDLIGALILAVLTLPLFVIVGVIVALDVGLPLRFWQQRTGLHGRPFRLYKFRTMLPQRDGAGRRLDEDRRVSGIGHILRRTRLDELPQIYSVLIGRMSFVGPRPLLPVDQPELGHARFSVRPGLTGWAQINGGRDVTAVEKAALDAWYVAHASISLDLSILLKIIRILIVGDRSERAGDHSGARLHGTASRWPGGRRGRGEVGDRSAEFPRRLSRSAPFGAGGWMALAVLADATEKSREWNEPDWSLADSPGLR